MKLEIFIKEIEGDQYLCLKLMDLSLLKPKRKTFIPPTIEQVREYCKERKNHVNANTWMNHYQSNGWMVGKVKMKDWNAAVRKWETNSYSTIVDNQGEIHRGTNLGEPPPELFGVRSPTAEPMPQDFKDKFNIK